VIVFLKRKKLPVRLYIDMITVGLMIGLAFGRIGCYMNGCCFGKPTESVCSISFPYGSPSYLSQAHPDYSRSRTKPLINLPAEYFGYLSEDGQTWVEADELNKLRMNLKPYDMLTDEQKADVKANYPLHRIHPTQFYSTTNAFVLCLIFYLFWRKFGIAYQGCTFALMFILYSPSRFFLETLRDDNPFEKAWWIIYRGGTISQNIGIYMFIAGIIMMIIFPRFKSIPPKEMK
jgi:phosphatidylglycerol:prolipoprotein diacylglycerol transferase